MTIFVFIAFTVLADQPEKNFVPTTPIVDAGNGDFLPDTVNVFKIAKEVSNIFSEAVRYTSLNDIYGDTVYLNALFTANYGSNDVAEAYKNDVEARIKSQRGDIGVNFKADYSENFKPGFSSDEDIYYKRRFYFGVEWNVIKGGFLASRAKANALEKEYYLKDIDAQKREDAENYRYIFNYINYIFNKQKIDVLHERSGLIEQQLKFTTELYHLRYVGWENVLKVRAKLEDLNQQITQLENFNKHIPNSIPDTLLTSQYSAKNLPLVDIDLDKLMKIYHNNETTDTIAALKLAMFSDGMKWWQDISLRPYLRYNLYIDPLNASRRFGSGGVSLSVPLRFKNKENLISAQKRIYQAESMSVSQAGDNELVNYYAEFAFKLKQIKDFYYKKLFADELIRKELVKKDYQDIGFNPIFTLSLIDDKKNIEAEIIDIKKRLYIQLVQMAFYLDEKSPLAFVEILNPRDFTSRYKTGVQIFVDNATFQGMSNADLVNYLWKNEFRDVVLEIDSWNLSPKIGDLIEKASRDHIYFTLNMKIPDGQTYPDVNGDLQQISKINNQYISGLHYSLVLDSDTSIAREIQEVDFSDWVNGIDISKKSKDIRLSISIADDLPMNVLSKVYSKFDLVFIPTDGTPNRKKLENKLIQELSLGKEKLTVILDANDFADRIHIENYMANLNEETGVENFAFSNIKNMIDADLRTYEMGEKNSSSSVDVMAALRNQIFADDEKNKEILQAKLDTIANIVKENNDLDEAANNQKVEITITDNRSGEETITLEPNEVVNNQKTQSSIEEARIYKEDETITLETDEVVGAKTVVVPKTRKSVEDTSDRVWQIQFAAAKVNLSDEFLKNKFKIIETINVYKVNGYNKYTIGSYNNENEARAALKDYKAESGNTSAFIVSYE
ncbi:MAG: hypothetical protein DRI74_00840 [Bacteroidetes bacterium]|nr:MAG: hypothetical protein DRI74_00840 [Bacteroidota bacterium]